MLPPQRGVKWLNNTSEPAESTLRVALVQEGWAFRAGVFWPLLSVLGNTFSCGAIERETHAMKIIIMQKVNQAGSRVDF